MVGNWTWTVVSKTPDKPSPRIITAALIEKMLGANPHEPLERRSLTLEDVLDRHTCLDRTARTVRTEQAVDPVAPVVFDPFKIVRMKCPDRDDHFEPDAHCVELVR